MKFSEKWLREWIDPAVDTETLAEQLTMAGLEVDAMEPVAPDFSGVVVGEVTAVEPHPDADKLRVCRVEVAADEPLTIVCGAANVRVGLRAPTALVGATLPGGMRIKRAQLRGVASFGMLCSASELGLVEASEGLMALPEDAPPGADLRDYLSLDDVSIELGLTPNRSDCLGIAGIAREVGVLNRMPVEAPEMAPVAAVIEEPLMVSVEAPAACPRYTGRVIRGVDPHAQTPLWMQERLRRSGLRSLGVAVDITNYVLLELGQPMHAFDLDKLQGGLQVRHAREGERLELLNGERAELDPETLVIADDSGPVAMAGIMGGAATAVTPESENLFLESAFFAPDAIAGRARAQGLHTDSSHRFERGVSPDLQRRALERATALFQQITGGEAGPVVEQLTAAQLPSRAPISLRQQRIQRVLGVEVASSVVEEILERLGMVVTPEEKGWRVTPPPFRFDIEREEDLLEEVGRIHGYNRLPSSRPAARLQMAPVPEARVPLRRLRQILVQREYQEAITYSFVDPVLQEMLDPERPPIPLANPISAEMAVMRTSLWPGLVETLRCNSNRQQSRVRIFESGLRFIRQGAEIVQENRMAGLVWGALTEPQWGQPQRSADLFDVKADLLALFAPGGRAPTFSAAGHPALQPGQSARISVEGTTVGWLGALHPRIGARLDVAGPVILFEIALPALQQGGVPQFSPLSKFPAIRRDIALLVERSLPVGELEKYIREVAPALVRGLKLFDLYQGEGVDSSRKSVAFSLTLQDDSRTLTDSEVDAAVERVLAALADKFGAELRE